MLSAHGMCGPVAMRARCRRVLFRVLPLLLLATVSACTFRPGTIDAEALNLSAAESAQDGVTVRARVVTDDEAERMFGVDLGGHGIQAVWLSVRNDTPERLHYLPVATDREYFSPLEVAWKVHRRFAKEDERRIERMFVREAMPMELPPGGESRGFVFTNRDLGIKVVNVDLLGGVGRSWQFSFLLKVPGIKLDVERINLDALDRTPRERNLGRDELRAWLAEQPCCTTSREGSSGGDPLNFVVVGDPHLILSAFAQRGWDLTERIHGGSIWETTKSFLLGTSYRYSPVSALYYLGRRQDLALQKARGDIHQRNHFRLWRAPVDCEKQPVWMGQISRDIGVRFTTASPTLTTHKIDPDVDEARDYLVQDMLYSQRLAEFGYLRAMPPATLARPGHNLTGDVYYTDGYRAVLFFHAPLTPLDQVKSVGWEAPDRSRSALLQED